MKFASIKKLVYGFVSHIPKGQAVSYGFIAKRLNLRSARLVGRALHENPHPNRIPCHRVVYADGSLSGNYAFGGEKVQREKLLEEGIRFKNRKADISQLKNSTSSFS